MNLVLLGDKQNRDQISLSTTEKLATAKPRFKQVSNKEMEALTKISAQADPDAFASDRS